MISPKVANEHKSSYFSGSQDSTPHKFPLLKILNHTKPPLSEEPIDEDNSMLHNVKPQECKLNGQEFQPLLTVITLQTGSSIWRNGNKFHLAMVNMAHDSDNWWASDEMI